MPIQLGDLAPDFVAASTEGHSLVGDPDRKDARLDEEALGVFFGLLADEGLCLGGSSGIDVAGAMRLGRDLGPGHTVVTVLPDGRQRSQSKLFDPVFLEARNGPAPPWLGGDSRGEHDA